jgi:hypothetical protein
LPMIASSEDSTIAASQLLAGVSAIAVGIDTIGTSTGLAHRAVRSEAH